MHWEFEVRIVCTGARKQKKCIRCTHHQRSYQKESPHDSNRRLEDPYGGNTYRLELIGDFDLTLNPETIKEREPFLQSKLEVSLHQEVTYTSKYTTSCKFLFSQQQLVMQLISSKDLYLVIEGLLVANSYQFVEDFHPTRITKLFTRLMHEGLEEISIRYESHRKTWCRDRVEYDAPVGITREDIAHVEVAWSD